MRIRILPYKMTSESARLLARELQCLRIYPDRSTYKPKHNHLIINWGCGSMLPWIHRADHIVNHPYNVQVSANKLSTFLAFKESTIPSPLWTQSREEAAQWVTDGNTVYCRTTVTGHGGEGIVLANSTDEIIGAKLYTKGVANENEYRVHIFDGRVIDYVRKARRRGEETRPSHYIRNYKQGWVFIREGVQLPEVVRETAKRAVQSVGLTFGAVDICTVAETNEQECVVFEINSAPGIMNTSVVRYAEAIKAYERKIRCQ